jgi:putative ABC transport system permease protein
MRSATCGATRLSRPSRFGLAGAWAATRVLKDFLFEVTPFDPPTFAAVSLLLALVALVACYIPARRAAAIDPLVALRYE